jgi:hypothetical protein
MAKFKKLDEHPMLGKDYKKLAPLELAFCQSFISDTSNMTDDEFAHKVNRLGLAGELENFKNKSLIWALLSQSIETVKRNRRS